MRNRRLFIARLLAAFALSNLPGIVIAQTVGVSNGNARVGSGSPAPIYVTFAAGAAPVAAYSLTLSYMPSLFGTPAVSACFANATCTVDAGAGSISVVRANTAPVALQSETACLLVFTNTGGAAQGVFPLSIANAQAVDPNGDPVALGTGNGAVGIISGGGEPPRLSYLPTFDTDCATDQAAELRFDDALTPGTVAIDLAATPGAPSAEALLLACTAPGGISIIAGGNQMLQGAATAAPIVLNCDTPSPQNRTLTCTETTSNGIWFRHWDLACTGPVFVDSFEGEPDRP
jgi:hypothetical protein